MTNTPGPAALAVQGDPDRLQALRADVAMAAGLDPRLASRLTGSTRAELEADAAELAKLAPPTTPTASPFAVKPAHERLLRTLGAAPDAPPDPPAPAADAPSFDGGARQSTPVPVRSPEEAHARFLIAAIFGDQDPYDD